MKMRVADYLTDALYRAGGEKVFLITGGMIMHLTDALLRHGKQRFVACHHESAAVMAADAWGRQTGRIGVAYVTAGPGALNTLTGVVGAYVDTAPCVVVAGQSKVSQATVTGPRQFALQGFNTLPIFEKVTKFAVMLDDPKRVRHHVERALWEATHGRPGPVWIETPIDVQGAMMDPEDQEGFTPPPSALVEGESLDREAARVADLLRASRRPAILAGAGVRCAGAVERLQRFVEAHGLPLMTSRLGMDLVPDDHALFVGRPGTYGDRPANFTCQNADLLLVLGCRLGLGLVGHDYAEFGKRARKVMVDVDPEELRKPAVVPDLPVLADAGAFLAALDGALGGWRLDAPRWLARVGEWRARYPVDVPGYELERPGINSYHFTRLFSEQMEEGDLFVLDTGSCFHVHAQAFKVKRGQRHIVTGGLSTMGYVPAVIGVCAAEPGRDVYCITGDGSLQMNLQELATLRHHRFRAKLIVFNNDGYLLIRHSQKNFQDGRYIGESPRSGVSFPALEKLAATYDMGYVRIERSVDVAAGIAALKAFDGPAICEVINPPEQLLCPRVASKRLDDGTMVSMPFDDMFPFLPREEYQANQAWRDPP